MEGKNNRDHSGLAGPEIVTEFGTEPVTKTDPGWVLWEIIGLCHVDPVI